MIGVKPAAQRSWRGLGAKAHRADSHRRIFTFSHMERKPLCRDFCLWSITYLQTEADDGCWVFRLNDPRSHTLPKDQPFCALRP